MKNYWVLFIAGFVVFFFGFIKFNNITELFMLLGTAIFIIALYEWYSDEMKRQKKHKGRSRSGNTN